MAESELGVLSSQCLDRRIPDKQILTDEVAAWEKSRNKRSGCTRQCERLRALGSCGFDR